MLIARTYHIQGNLEQASKFYESARETYNREESKMPAALFMGLGQMALHKKELNAAVHYFESGLKKNPESKDLLLMLGSIYANNEKLKKRVEATRYLQSGGRQLEHARRRNATHDATRRATQPENGGDT